MRWLPLGLLLLVPLYLYAARSHSEKFNTDLYQNDQKVYLRLAEQIKKKGTDYFTPRQRTPGFSYLLAPFWDENLAAEGKKSAVGEPWFERAKQINITLSVVLLAGLWFFFRRTTGVVEAVLLTSGTGFLLYVFRAGYVQPELLYWTLNLVAFYLLARMLVSPGWLLAVIGGAVSGIAFFVKAGTQPLMLLFVVSFAIKIIWDRIHHKKPFAWQTIAQGVVVPLVFVLVLSPYLHGSYKAFGSPFYSTYSKYIMWVRVGDKDEMYAIMRAGAAVHPITEEDFQREYAKLKQEKGEPVAEQRIPTVSRYLDEHSLGEILGRPLDGIHKNHRRMERYYRSAYVLLKICFVLAVILAVWKWEAARRNPIRGPSPGATAVKHLPVTLYVLGFFTGYLLLYGWYDGLKIGVRLMLSLYVPALFVLAALIRRFSDGLTITVKGHTLYVRKIVNAVLLVLIVVLSHGVLTDKLYKYYSGA